MEAPEQNDAAQALRDELGRLEAKAAATRDPDILGALHLRMQQIAVELSGMLTAASPSAPASAAPAEEEVADAGPVENKLANVEAQRLAQRDEGLGDGVIILTQQTVRSGVHDETPPAQLQEAERLVREARVAKMRGQSQVASDLLKQAATAAPRSGPVLLGVADEYYERQQYAPALEMYRQLLEVDPSNLAAERRVAELSLRVNPGLTIEQQMRLALGDSTLVGEGDAMASAKAAALISLFIPGGGQMALGRWASGIAIFVVWSLCIGVLVVMRDDVKAVISMAAGRSTHGSMFVLVPLFVAIVLQLGSIFGCLSSVQAHPRQILDKPRPPVDLPFE